MISNSGHVGSPISVKRDGKPHLKKILNDLQIKNATITFKIMRNLSVKSVCSSKIKFGEH